MHIDMSQLNIQMTAEFESKLRRYMAARGIRTKSEAIRQAVEEGLARIPEPVVMNWAGLRGKGLGTSQPQFANNDQLWESL
jgi:hypothetical protein